MTLFPSTPVAGEPVVDNHRATAVVEILPWLAPFLDMEPFSPEYHAAAESFKGMRLRLTRDFDIKAGAGLIWEVSIGAYRPSPRVLPAGTVLRFDQVSTGCEDPCSWIGPPAPVFAVEGGPSDGYPVGFYVAWLKPGAVRQAAAIEILSTHSRA